MKNGSVNWYKGFMAQTKRLESRTEKFPNQVILNFSSPSQLSIERTPL